MCQRLLRKAIVAFAILFTSTYTVMVVTPVYAQEQSADLVQFGSDTDLKALAEKGPTVVFFFATWCPNCILTLTELQEKWDEINPDLTIIIADYDRETALKAEYGVTYQDTFVLLDEKGSAKKLWNGGGVNGINVNTEIK